MFPSRADKSSRLKSFFAEGPARIPTTDELERPEGVACLCLRLGEHKIQATTDVSVRRGKKRLTADYTDDADRAKAGPWQ